MRSRFAFVTTTAHCFEVRRQRIGMDRETREKAFTLFFSSKGTEGTVGLFISNRIANRTAVPLPSNRTLASAPNSL